MVSRSLSLRSAHARQRTRTTRTRVRGAATAGSPATDDTFSVDTACPGAALTFSEIAAIAGAAPSTTLGQTSVDVKVRTFNAVTNQSSAWAASDGTWKIRDLSDKDATWKSGYFAVTARDNLALAVGSDRSSFGCVAANPGGVLSCNLNGNQFFQAHLPAPQWNQTKSKPFTKATAKVTATCAAFGAWTDVPTANDVQIQISSVIQFPKKP